MSNAEIVHVIYSALSVVEQADLKLATDLREVCDLLTANHPVDKEILVTLVIRAQKLVPRDSDLYMLLWGVAMSYDLNGDSDRIMSFISELKFVVKRLQDMITLLEEQKARSEF
jgi:hypothetical protein